MTRDKMLYTAKTRTTGGRDGAARSDDGRLDVKLSSPGTPGTGTNPGSCSPSTPRSTSAPMTATTSSGLASPSACRGWSAESPRPWLDAGHQTCPYSKATRGDIDVAISLA
jgi:lipoyl-dependent peroxiredoxin